MAIVPAAGTLGEFLSPEQAVPPASEAPFFGQAGSSGSEAFLQLQADVRPHDVHLFIARAEVHLNWTGY
jgi:hypothetical protein